MIASIQNYTPQNSAFPEGLHTVQPAVQQLFVRSNNWHALLQRPRVAIVGSRKITPYGKTTTTTLAGELARAGIVIVSGLAFGVDACAHRAALEAGGLTIAVMPGGLDNIYPASHRHLAAQVVSQGGALITEYDEGMPVMKHHFIERNRIVAGIAKVIIVTEATHKSGTMHTARFALEQGKDVFAIPGMITSPSSAGTNQLIKTGAGLITDTSDILLALGITPTEQKRVIRVADPHQQQIIDLLASGEQDGAIVFQQSNIPITVFNQALTMLEITGVIRALGNNQWALAQ